jgi:oligopeptidase B
MKATSEKTAAPPGGAHPGEPTPPAARKSPKSVCTHGRTYTDEYSWLCDISDPEVIAYLDGERAYAEAIMRPTLPLQQKLYEEFVGRLESQDSGMPYRVGGHLYYRVSEAGKQYPTYRRRRAGVEDAEEVTLDLNELAAGHDYLDLGLYTVSGDGRLLAYAVDTTGSGCHTLYVKDLETGRVYPGSVERVAGAVWAADGRTLFYTTEDEQTRRPCRLFRRVVGGFCELVYEEADELYELRVTLARDRRLVFVTSASKTTTEVRFILADSPGAAPSVISPRAPGHQYYAHHRGGLFYIRTNLGAENFRVVVAPAPDARRENWRELVPHREAVLVKGIELFADHCVVWEREDGLQHIRVVDLRGGDSHRVAFDEPVYHVAEAANPEFHTNLFRFAYQSFVTPGSVYDYNMDTRERTLLKEVKVRGYDASRYASERVFATATDGAKIPVTLVYRKGVRGPRPLLLEGYGAYGVSAVTAFSQTRLSLLDRGVVYAVAHVRGGGEMGEAWHEAGRLSSKRNSFIDFVSAAEHLIEHGYANKDRLAAWGASAGGLLVAAAANMRPGLFKALVLDAPFVDVLNTMLNRRLPLTVGEYLEWGDPRDPRVYEEMRAYSPYENIRAEEYPAMLVKAWLNDSHVLFWGPAKYVARLRAAKKGAAPLLFKVGARGGHGGPSGLHDALREVAFDYAFVLERIGEGAI